MSLILRLKSRDLAGAEGPPPPRSIRLEASFYQLQELIELVDEAIYMEQTVTLLTAAQDAFDLDPRKYAAIAVLEQED